MKKKKALKILKVAGYVVGAILVLLIILVFSLRIPAVQNQIKNYVVNYLEDKIETEVSLERVYVDFPSSIVLENLHLHGQKKDTLLYAHKLDVGLDIPKLLNNTVDLTSIDIESVRANVVRDEDGRFNFDYIIDAFVTEDEEVTESEPWVISLDEIHLQDIGVTFLDLQQQNDLQVYFNNFETTVEEFDLDQNNYAIDKIILDGLNLKMQQDLVKEVATEVEQNVDSLSAQSPIQLALNEVVFTNFKVDYADDNTQTYGKIQFEELSSNINELDLQNQLYDVEDLVFKNADLKIDLHLPETDAEEEVADVEVDPQEQSDLTAYLNQLKLDNVKLVYNNTAMPRSGGGMDFNHLDFQTLNIELEDFKMEDGTFAGIVESARVQEQENLNIHALETSFRYDKQQAYLKDLLLKTDKTILRDEVVLSYDHVDQLSDNLGAVQLSANIEDSKIGFRDILNFMPSLRQDPPFNQYPDAVLNLNANVNGTVDNLIIENLEANGLGDIQLATNGTIKNATHPDALTYDLNIQNLSGSARTINKLVPPNTIPDNISLPSTMRLSGTAKGTTEIVDANLNLQSSDGNAKVIAHLNLTQENNEQYDVDANLDDLNIGKIIQNQDLEKISGSINAKGRSFDFEQGDADLAGNIQYVDYNGYRYNNMVLDGSLKQGRYDIDLDSKDQNANLTLRVNGLYNEENPTIVVAGNIRKLDLHALNFYSDQMILAGNINGEFTNVDPDNLNGEFTLTNFAISDTEDVYPLQEVYFKSVTSEESNSLILNSQVVDAEITGDYKLTEILGSLMQTINGYYQFQESIEQEPITPNQYANFEVKVKDDKVLRKFVPDLESFETVTLQGSYVADTKKLQVDGQIPQLTYSGYHVDNGVLAINTENEALNYQLSVANVSSEDFQLNQLDAHGNVANNKIVYHISTQDTAGDENYLIAGNLESIDDIHQISLDPNGLKLNGENWEVGENNLLQINNEGGIYAENFVLSNAGSIIKIQSQRESMNNPLQVDIENFDIATITEIIKKEELPASGTINGTVTVENLQSNMRFEADLNIQELNVYEQLVGRIDAKVNSENVDLLNIDIQLSENGNDATITGTYGMNNDVLNLVLDLNQLQMQSLEGLTMNEIEDTEGYLSGDLNITGTTEAPRILGTVSLNDVGLHIAQTGSDFRQINDEIYFREQGIVFDQFNVNDNSGNSLIVDGQISTQTYQDFAFNLDVNSEDFKVVDSEEDLNQLMYGVLTINADLHIGGDLDLPLVDGLIAVGDETDFTFVVPQESPTLEEREGIVRFVDKDIALQETVANDSINTEASIKGMNMNVDISITEEAKVSLIIDKATGDFVKLQGNAELTGGVDPSGKTTLTGVYEVSEGAYELNVSMMNKRFDIQKGSTIVWNGDPLEATLDITANYKIEAAPIDLLQQQLSGMAPSEYNMYKQRIPFNTLLMMKGELMKPEITFDITLEDDNPSIATSVIDNTKTKLDQIRQDESEMNKQVFALLLLNRFIGEDPFSSESGMSAGTMARQSVSQILSQQLNNLASGLIAGVEMDFDFDSYDDYSQGQKNTRTDLNVGLSKRLLNDRLKITVGSKFGLEGSARENEELNNIAGDLSIDYMLSKNGRYMLRAFRMNEYEVALQGQIIETGVSFIINLDFDEFKDVFKKAKKGRKEND
ncbi:translocation/assembly module TamB [Flavobacteriaceae bacterium Ap0902]|nr:translocation/assembly module TamB [Flavobacteriaceae bacterium Ap0902]